MTAMLIQFHTSIRGAATRKVGQVWLYPGEEQRNATQEYIFDEGSYTSVFMVWNWHPGFFPVDNVIVLCFTI